MTFRVAVEIRNGKHREVGLVEVVKVACMRAHEHLAGKKRLACALRHH